LALAIPPLVAPPKAADLLAAVVAEAEAAEAPLRLLTLPPESTGTPIVLGKNPTDSAGGAKSWA